MFFDGDLRSGLALALKESKYVVCFVKGNDEQSALWEDTYFSDDQVHLALSTRAVTLRIHTGSQEAAYLSAYYPVPVVPALVIIQNGQLCLDIRSGETRDSFKASVLKSLVDKSSLTALTHQPRSIPPATEEPSTSQQSMRTVQNRPSTFTNLPSEPPSTSAQSTMAMSSVAPPASVSSGTNIDNAETLSRQDASSTRSSQTIQNLLADRRRKLDIDKKEKEATEKAKRKAKSDARQAAMTADPDSAKAKQATYAKDQRKRQQGAKSERERILRQIEHDRAERKEKEEWRKALAKAEAEGKDGAEGLIDQQLSNEINDRQRPAKAKECAIQVRMFDGSTIRNTFPADQTLRANVRPWVDKERFDGDLPFTFKQILAPLPNRTLSVSEEEQTLQSLSLIPSATLVMVPVQSYTPAYIGNQSIVSKSASVGYNAISAGAGLVSGALGTVLGFGQATAPVAQPSHHGAPRMTSTTDGGDDLSGVNIRTLRDEREDRDNHQLYNGNHLNFEPRNDHHDKED